MQKDESGKKGGRITDLQRLRHPWFWPHLACRREELWFARPAHHKISTQDYVRVLYTISMSCEHISMRREVCVLRKRGLITPEVTDLAQRKVLRNSCNLLARGVRGCKAQTPLGESRSHLSYWDHSKGLCLTPGASGWSPTLAPACHRITAQAPTHRPQIHSTQNSTIKTLAPGSIPTSTNATSEGWPHHTPPCHRAQERIPTKHKKHKKAFQQARAST